MSFQRFGYDILLSIVKLVRIRITEGPNDGPPL